MTHPLIKPIKLGLLFLLPLLLFACDALNLLSSTARPSAKVVSTTIDGLDLNGLNLNFGVEIQNPYSTNIPLTQLSYALATEGTPFLSGQLADKPESIAAMGSTVVQVPVRINFQKAMQMVSSIQPGKSVPYQADLTISVDALGLGNVDIPLRQHGQIPIPDLPKIEVSDVAWQEISMSKARAEVKLKMTNPNDFALALQQMNYRFSLGGNEIANSQLQVAQSLASNEASEVTIPLEFAPMSLGMGVLNLIKGSGASYELNGDLKVGTDFGPMEFPLAKTGEVNFNR